MRLGRRIAWMGLALLAWAELALAQPAGGSLSALPPPPPPRVEVEAASPELAQHTREIVLEAGAKLGAWLGSAPERVRLVICSDQAEYRARVAAVRGPEWAAGLALPQEGLILLRSPKLLLDPNQYRLLVIHELTHLYLHAALRHREHPLWLEEGLAMYAADEGGLGRAAAMTRGVLGRGLIPFAELESHYPADEAQVELAYAQSYYFVSWLLNQYGPGVLRQVVASLARGRETTQAFHAATGQGLAALEARFGEEMASRFSWLAVLTAGGSLWALVSLGAGLGLVLRRRAQKRLLRSMPDGQGNGGVYPMRRLGPARRRASPRPGPTPTTPSPGDAAEAEDRRGTDAAD